VAESQEVPKGATDEEMIRATKDRSMDLRLAIGCRRQLKTRTKCNGGSCQECGAAARRPTRHTVLQRAREDFVRDRARNAAVAYEDQAGHSAAGWKVRA
jgi:hypothetical protein